MIFMNLLADVFVENEARPREPLLPSNSSVAVGDDGNLDGLFLLPLLFLLHQLQHLLRPFLLQSEQS